MKSAPKKTGSKMRTAIRACLPSITVRPVRKTPGRKGRRRVFVTDPMTLKIGLGITGFGLLLLGSAIWIGIARSSTAGKEVAEGEVVELRWHTNGRGAAPVTEFEVDGEAVTVSSRVYSTLHPEVGDRVKVVYPSGNPGKGRIHSFGANWFLPLILSFVALVALYIGVMTLKTGMRKGRG